MTEYIIKITNNQYRNINFLKELNEIKEKDNC